MRDLLHETRRYPAAKYPWLRVQVGRMETRPMRVPVYGSNRMLRGHEESSKRVSVFRLLGYGETVAQAEAMAKATETV